MRVIISLLCGMMLIATAFASEAQIADTAPVGPVAITDGNGYLPPEIDLLAWTVGANMPTARYSEVTGWWDGMLYVSHGRQSNSVPYNTAACEAYNPVTNSWTTMTDAPTARRMVAMGQVQIDNILYSVGGRFDASTTVGTNEAYDMSSDTWTTLAPCTPRWAHGGAAEGGYVWVFGSSSYTSSVERYDPAANLWQAVTPLPSGDGWVAGASLNGYIYCIGGATNGTRNIRYDVSQGLTGTWETMAPLPASRKYHTAAAASGGDVYVVGGWDGSTVYFNNTWIGGSPDAGKIYVFGGTSSALPDANVYVYDPVTNTWATDNAMPGAESWGGCGAALGPPPPPPDVSITMTPISPPIIIPPGGGSFDFDVTITNNEAGPATFDAWIIATLPGGGEVLVLGPISLTRPGSSSLTRLRTQNVPANAPAGNYTYTGYVGFYPGQISDSDSFPFTKSADDNGGGLVSEWANSGESFEAGLEAVAPAEFTLLDNYPNPFNPSTTIRYALTNSDFVNLTVFDLTGREVATLVNGYRDAGSHEVTFDASALASGVYAYRLTAGSQTATAKMVLMK